MAFQKVSGRFNGKPNEELYARPYGSVALPPLSEGSDIHRSDSTDGFVPSVCKHKPPPDPAKDQGAVSFFRSGHPAPQKQTTNTDCTHKQQTRTANQNRDQGLPSPIAPSNRDPAETNRTHKLRTRTTNRPHGIANPHRSPIPRHGLPTLRTTACGTQRTAPSNRNPAPQPRVANTTRIREPTPQHRLCGLRAFRSASLRPAPRGISIRELFS